MNGSLTSGGHETLRRPHVQFGHVENDDVKIGDLHVDGRLGLDEGGDVPSPDDGDVVTMTNKIAYPQRSEPVPLGQEAPGGRSELDRMRFNVDDRVFRSNLNSVIRFL